MKLVPEARKWYRMYSVQALLVIAGIQSVLAYLTEAELEMIVPLTDDLTWKALGRSLTIVAAIIGAMGRVVDQGQTTTPHPTEDTL